MKKIIVLAAAAALFTSAAAAQESGMGRAIQDPPLIQSQEQTWEGFLVDVRTAETLVKDPGSAESKAAASSKSDLLAQGEKNGFGIVVGSAWFKLDAAGNTRAQSVLRDAKSESAVRVIVTGRLYGDTISVLTIREAEERQSAPQY